MNKPDDPPLKKPSAWLVDVDGTLALRRDRDPYDWRSAHTDAPNKPVVGLVQALERDPQIAAIIVVSGRHEQARYITAKWLELHGIPFNKLLMRADGDYRSDEIVKEELFRNRVDPQFHVVGVLDDRDRVVQMWRRIGLVCLQVAPGDF